MIKLLNEFWFDERSEKPPLTFNGFVETILDANPEKNPSEEYLQFLKDIRLNDPIKLLSILFQRLNQIMTLDEAVPPEIKDYIGLLKKKNTPFEKKEDSDSESGEENSLNYESVIRTLARDGTG